MISEETLATIDQAEPNYSAEAGFAMETETPAPKRKGGPGRGHKGPVGTRSHKKKTPGVSSTPAPVAVADPPAEPSKSLVKGAKWILRNVVTVMEEAYGWDKPDDYEEWLTEASQFGAGAIQKHFPNWMDQWGDEILLLAMLLLWVTPNVSKQLGKRKKSNPGNAGTEGKREDNATVSFAQSA